MLGKRLMTAAKAINDAGKQINLMVSYLEKFVDKVFLEEGIIVSTNGSQEDEIQMEEDWLVKSYIINYPLYRSNRHTNPYAWIGFMFTLYDEDELAQIDGYEPSICVMFGPGGKDEYFEAGAFDYKKCKLLTDGRLWLYADNDNPQNFDSWFFVLPLTSIGTQEDLLHFVVEPLVKLLKKGEIDVEAVDLETVFTRENPVFRFSKEGDKIKVTSSGSK